MGLSRLSKACHECKYKDTCNNKRMEAVAFMPMPILAPNIQPSILPSFAKTIQPHDYRNIKIDADTTVTIDLEEIKKKLNEQFALKTCHL